ncbi:uncharacterized protein UBRO_21017 [Ustilago bromivora]|uniref:Uncharacterized protein n=1 Tax=Ustilago bromivora TaxID=307758 RepID=A0A1K0GCP4_9BASI|nr:uncharacterized protein UBRO_21017 [Ustilago bromivora]
MTASTQLFEGVDDEFEQTEKKHKIPTQQLWHEHLGHPGQDKSKVIMKSLGGECTKGLDPDTALTCEQCIQSKSTVVRMGKGSGERASAPLDLIHVDLIIDTSHATEHTCMLVLVNDHSKCIYTQPLLHKSHVFAQLKKIVVFLETQTGRRLKAIRCDQGTEWRSHEALEWSKGKGIEWQTTTVSWGWRYAQEGLDSYEGTMHSNCELGQRRVLTELSKIGRIEGSMTELLRDRQKQSLTTELIGISSIKLI